MIFAEVVAMGHGSDLAMSRRPCHVLPDLSDRKPRIRDTVPLPPARTSHPGEVRPI
ncbi:hypothetical protein FRACA_2000010 [Frankia canadensis]|uniref:Uncharacterized protein n=1 Tax=Frankia canadensis TaxID=1836972 RepID=A0A2I2KQ79_9ACTN|nr:hypothetical protein FRACA_2000010 [Frankia canadensis]SOU55115.1 hypothetical protein FRACA_2000010 [Frankia canadensis]